MKVSKIALAVTALLAGSAALADPILPNPSGSDIFVVVYNANAADTNDFGKTVVEALPDTAAQLPSTSTTFNLDPTLQSDLGASSPSDLRYVVVAATQTTQGTVQFTSSNTLAGVKANVLTGTEVNNGVGQLAGYFGSLTFNAANTAVIPSGATEWTGSAGAGAPQDVFEGLYAASAAVGTSMEFYQAVSQISGRTTVAVDTDLNGQFGVNLANDTLSWTPSAVPLPAAVWLLLSGVAGVGGLGRRRAVRAEDAISA